MTDVLLEPPDFVERAMRMLAEASMAARPVKSWRVSVDIGGDHLATLLGRPVTVDRSLPPRSIVIEPNDLGAA